MKEEDGKLSSGSRLFDQRETRLSCLFHAEPQEGTATIILRIAKKPAEAAVRLEKGFEAPMGKRGAGEDCTGSVSACYPLRFGPKLLEEVCRVEIAACLCNQALTVDPKENGRWECDLSVCGW